MGKYTSGVDWNAAIHMMSAIEELHSCRVECHVRTATKRRAGGIDIDLEAHFDVVPGSDLPRVVKVSHQWPTRTTDSMSGLFYNLCWQLDYAIQQAYEQMPLSEK
jgi:hypothetical protein